MGLFARLTFSILLGALGGAIFYYFELPLAWMLGSMFFTTIAALLGAPIALHMPFRLSMTAVLGTLLGSAFTPQILHELQNWGAGALTVALFVAFMTTISVLFFVRVGGMSRATAFFSGTPGGLGEMTLVGEQNGGDPRTIALIHAIRIFVVVFFLPLVLAAVTDLNIPNTARALSGRPTAEGGELVILTLCAIVGYILGQKIPLPGSQIFVPMLVSAVAYLAGLVEGRPPAEVISAAQVVIGSAIGARFVGVNLRTTGRPIFLGTCSALGMLGLAAAFAYIVSPLLGLPMYALLLAISPGGLAEMSLVALALDVDTAFVATMHLVRIVLIVTFAPAFFRALGWTLTSK